MSTDKARRPSPLQRRMLIVLAGLERNGITRVRTRDLEHLLEQGGEAPVYGPNLRASCRRMETAGWLRTLRAPNMQLAVELTDAGRELGAPLLAAEQVRVLAEQQATEVVVLPLTQAAPPPADDTSAADRPVDLDGRWYLACRGDYVIRLDGTTCLQLWNTDGRLNRLTGYPLQVAQWLQACHIAGIDIRVQINESTTAEEGTTAGTQPANQTDVWYRQLETSLQAQGISGLTDEIRQAVVIPAEALRSLPAPSRLLHILRESEEAFVLTATTYEEDTGDTLDTQLSRAGFTSAQAQELRRNRIRWPLMDEEEYSRRELNTLLDELERRQLFCNRDQLTALVFSPVRKPGESWTERLQWLLSTPGFGFNSPLIREQAGRALAYLAGFVGQDVSEQLAASVTWAEDEQQQ